MKKPLRMLQSEIEIAIDDNSLARVERNAPDGRGRVQCQNHDIFILFLLPFVIFKRNFLIYIIIFAILLILIILYQLPNIYHLLDIYFGEGRFRNYYQAPAGAKFRILLVIISSIIFLLFRNKLSFNNEERKVMTFFSICF